MTKWTNLCNPNMKKLLAGVLCILLVGLLLTSCAILRRIGKNNPSYDVAMIGDNILEANAGFAFDIFRSLNAEDSEQSVFISPLSISAALTMTYNGAETTTREAMSKVLGFNDADREQVNLSYNHLLGHLEQVDKKVVLNIANSIWVREGEAVKEDFLNRNKDTFRAEIAALDLSKESSLNTINAWISKATKGKIERMLAPPPDPQVVMYLINAIYFKGQWTTPFEPERTFDGVFTALDGTKQAIRMMNRHGRVEYTQGEDYKAVRLPYGNGNISMIAILPDEDIHINTFVEAMNHEQLSTIRSTLIETEDVNLQIPRFELEYGIKQLNDSLAALGMEEAFSSRADFSGIRPGIYISEVLHKAVIEVNEEGSEAAAATVVVMQESAVLEPVTFIADRPFLFLIMDEKTETILFMGKVAGIPSA